MSIHKTTSLLVLFINFILLIKGSEYTVNTKVGKIKGEKRSILMIDGARKDITEFLGIPFAKPPLGELRFHKPIAVERFHTTFNALEYGLPCPQYFKTDHFLNRKPPAVTSEDCLNLNIRSPNTGGSERYPVMIFVHGGAFATGEASLYNSEVLSAYGEVVVVTFNYRVGPFGFLSTGDHQSPGNTGLWDQQLAIKWVNENIESFGGDVSRITLFGESAGAVSVAFQALHLPNQGMFHRIITQSGSPNAGWAVKSAGEALENAKKLAIHFNCTIPKDKSSQTIVNCLRSVQNATAIAVEATGENGFSWSPTVDEEFITLESIRSIQWPPASTADFQNFDMMIGTNGYEGHYLLTTSYRSILQLLKITEINQMKNLLETILKQGLKSFAPNLRTLDSMVDAAMFVYSNAENPLDKNFMLKQCNDFITDSIFFVAAYKDVASHAYNNNKTKTYQYEFNHMFPIQPPGNEWLQGATHTGEIPFVFGFPSSMIGYTPQIANIAWSFSKTVMDYWTNFAKTGNPNIPRKMSAKWKAYRPEEQNYLYFPASGEPKNGRYLNARRLNFWLEYLPKIITDGTDQGETVVTGQCSGSDVTHTTKLPLVIILTILILLVSSIGN